MKNILVNRNTKIIHAMRKLDDTREKGLLVVNKNKKLLGTLTDGDIRRQILKGYKLNSTIKKIYNKKPAFFVEGQFSGKDVKSELNKKKIDVIPIVDKNKKFIRYVTWSEFYGYPKKTPKVFDTSVVIMAGGKGLRLHPFTKVLPKPLVPINNKAIIEHIIDKFVSFGMKKFFITLNYKSKIIKSFFEEQKNKISTIKFLDEKKPLGTAGGLKFLEKRLSNIFFVSNCDVLIKTNYKDIYDFHKKNKNIITIVASTKEFEIPYGVCKINSRGLLSSMNEKPNYNFLVNTGLYVINKKALKFIPKGKKFDLTDLINKVKKQKGRVGAFPIEEKNWFDVGEWSEFEKTTKELNIIDV